MFRNSFGRRQLRAISWFIISLLLANLLLPTGSVVPLALAQATNPLKPGNYAQEQAWRLIRMRDENGQIPADGVSKAVEHIKNMPGQRQAPGGGGLISQAWTELGPGNTGGRVRSMVIHPTNPNIMWLGSVSGGIWKTTDAGASWSRLNDFLPNMAVASLAIDPTNPNVLYAGTGEYGFYDQANVRPLADSAILVRGGGIIKTTDGGQTWKQLPATVPSVTAPQWYYVPTLSIKGQTLLAGTANGLYRSVDGGNSWQAATGIPTDGTTVVSNLAFHPTNANLAVAGGYLNSPTTGFAWYSTDGGVSWTKASGISGWAGNAILAYAASSPNIVYASQHTNSGQIWKSTDGGQSYSLVNNTVSYVDDGDWAHVLWVDPTNPNLLIVGGVDLWRSTNGGANLTKISDWTQAPPNVPTTSTHADQHFVINAVGYNGSTNRTVFFGNDGGLYRVNDVSTVSINSGWQSLNNNLGITQFYSVAANSATGRLIGGTQDNGTLFYAGSGTYQATWAIMAGGDGSYAAYDPTDPNIFYGAYYNLYLQRNTTGGVSRSTNLGPPPDAVFNFIAPFILDPNNRDVMLAGAGDLWRSTDIRTAGSPSWSSIRSNINTGDNISAIAVGRSGANPSNTIWIGYNGGQLAFTTNGTAASPTWTTINNPNLPKRYVSRILIDPANSSNVYVSYGGYTTNNIWHTADGGTTWASVTGTGASSLPTVPVYSLVFNPANSNWLYAGTDVGLFTSQDGGATWFTPQDGPANVPVEEITWLNNTTIVAATYGRGMFKASLCASPLVVTKKVDDGSCGTLRMALGNATNSATIDLTALTPGSTITLMGTTGLSTPPNVTDVKINAGVCVNGNPPLTINGASVTGDVLTLNGTKGQLQGVKVLGSKQQAGREIYVPKGSSWKMSCVASGKI